MDDTSGSACVRELSDSDFTGQVKPEVRYTATLPPSGDSEARRFLDAVASYWQGRRSSVERPDTPVALHLQIRPYQDKYRLTILYYPAGHTLVLTGWLDECIWPNGAPEP
jgi:hypothetical protein